MEKEEGRKKLENIYKSRRSTPQTVEETLRLMSSDTYHIENPEQILGEAYETTNKYGDKIIAYRGSLESVIKKAKLDLSNFRVEEYDALETIIRTPRKRESFKKKANSLKDKPVKKRVRQKASPTQSISDSEMYSFEEIMQTYNKDISEEEVKAWIWYKRYQKHFIDSIVLLEENNGWSKYIVPISDDSYCKKWLKEGIMAYYQFGYIPSVLYYAENIYLKQRELEKDKDRIIELFGIEQYDKQKEGLKTALPEPLSLTTEKEDQRLIIKPNSDFCQFFKIKELLDGTKTSSMFWHSGNNESFSLHAVFDQYLDTLSSGDFKISSSYDIQQFYLHKANAPRGMKPEDFLRKKQNAKTEGDRLFQQFLKEALTETDQRKIELVWNSQFNGYVQINYFKVPIAFTCSSTFKNKPLYIRPAQREGLGFLAVHGGGCIAYDVGVGKTMTGILSIAHAIESGMCKRPLIVVPNQTYKNWLAEIRGVLGNKGNIIATGILPQYPINDLYNLGTKYIQPFLSKDGTPQLVEENTITVVTYEGFKRLAFLKETWDNLNGDLFSILNQGIESQRDATALKEKIEELMGKGSSDARYEIELFGFDFLLMDEAHIAKKIFTQVKGEVDSEGKRDKTDYKITSGSPSAVALKSFMIANYIQKNNNRSNVVLLTATPFTNSPLEIFSMLALIGYHRLKSQGLGNLQHFFNHFIQSSIELIINAKLKPERKEIIMGFNNLIALQKLIFQFIDYKSGEEAEIQRPNKIVLPMTHKNVDGVMEPVPVEEQISTTLTPNGKQVELMMDLERYLVGEIQYEQLCPPNSLSRTEMDESEDGSSATALQFGSLSEEEQEGTRILRGITLGRQIAFSPYLFSCSTKSAEEVNYEDFINSSPKLQYVMGCIASVKGHCERNGEEMSGQVIYSNAGISFFPHIKEYLVKKLGFEPEEIDFIKGGMAARKKEVIKDKFLKGTVKVLIGSQTIREGINLQNRATDLYNLWLDWNPTDLHQLEGRIWRFGNQFANVRIVIPLVEDSVDIAIFQKLEEKSSRINQLWHRAGKENTLKLENFNPAELKRGLISNPRRLAEMMILENGEVLRDEITGIKNQVAEIDTIVRRRETFLQYIGKIQDTVRDYKPLKEGQTERKMTTVFKLYSDYLEDPETNGNYTDKYALQEARGAYYDLEKAKERFLKPRKLDIHFDRDKLIENLESEIERKEAALKKRTNDEALQELTNQIIADRKKQGLKKKTVEERVQEFASLNEIVLGERMSYYSENEKEELQAKIEKGEKLVNVDDLLSKMRERVENLKKVQAIKERMLLLKNKLAA